jgi:plasmid maintenance system antidote protein VapI
MSPEHIRLAAALVEAIAQYGCQAALARHLGISPSELSDLINSKRFVTMRQALRIEAKLGIPARELLIEAYTAKVDEDLAKARKKQP